MNTVKAMKVSPQLNLKKDFKSFSNRHIGPGVDDVKQMLKSVGYESIEAFIKALLPKQIVMESEFNLERFKEELTEEQALTKIKGYAKENKVYRSLIGQGYYGTCTPNVILRNILENPGWYTQYTPYQPEISQGRLEALLNYQTMVSSLCGLDVANASLLDEGTAAAEAMMVCYSVVKRKVKDANKFVVSSECHPQTKAVVNTRAKAFGVEVVETSDIEKDYDEKCFGALIQYPDTYGEVKDFSKLAEMVHEKKGLLIAATDLMALNIIKAPGELGADMAIGNSQRFGVPLGYGGPHAAFFACKDEYKRLIPGRIVGVSKDVSGKPALRLALQTREQHIRREKATSNICTAQVLLAIMAGMYAVFHGPKGLKSISKDINDKTKILAKCLKDNGIKVLNKSFYDTLTIEADEVTLSGILKRAAERSYNFCKLSSTKISVAFDQLTSVVELNELAYIFTGSDNIELKPCDEASIPEALNRKSEVLKNEVFNKYHSETEFLRYVRRLESKDLSLGTAMIPLGSCTMKLNATSEMLPVSYPEFSNLHPFAPFDQAKGYQKLFSDLEVTLSQITGFAKTSLQPNAGSQGEYAGLLVIKAYHEANGDLNRDVCIIPKSAHGTNPASAIMAGFKVVPVNCDDNGNIDVAHLEEKIAEHKENLGALMVTYPSTHGVFEESIKDICAKIHKAGGQVYMDGANLNALVGLVKVQELGADVVHFNLHKTFCIPHGGGGPGMAPIAVNEHLKNFLPGHPLIDFDKDLTGNLPVAAAPYGSPSILPISWMYMAMMGQDGLKKASEIAILNANYIAKELSRDYKILYTGQNDLVAHECIIDLREFKESAGIEVDDIAKRLMDYGFHAPTVSWPVAGTIMIEPTESESKYELDRFINAMKSIRAEIREIEEGKASKESNVLKHAPHTAEVLLSETWDRDYSRELAAYPVKSQKDYKFWPAVSRIDNAYGDRNVVCTCPDMSEFD